MGTYSTTTTLDLLAVGVNFSATDTTTLASKLIDHAEAEINKYISKRYDLTSSYFQTSTSIPPLVKQWADSLAEGYLWGRLSRGGAGKESLKRSQELIKEVKENLQALIDFKISLVDSTGALIPDSSNTAQRVLCNTSDYSTTFNEDDELLQAVDSDKLDDIATERD